MVPCSRVALEHTGASRYSSAALKRVAWFAVARTPYNDFMFDRLTRVVDLTVVYTFKQLETHPWRFAGSSVTTLQVHDDFARCVALAKRADGIVFSGWHDPRYIALMALLPSRTPKAFWTDTLRTTETHGLRDLGRRALERYVFRRFDQVWSTGRVGCEVLRQLQCPPEKIRSLPFFYDLSRYEKLSTERRQQAMAFRERHAPTRQAVVFMGAGQLAKKKRFDDAIRALATCGSKDAVLWVCGVGPEEPELRRLAASLGVESQVVFHGWLQPEELELAFVAADVFVHPASLDPFPTVVLDAMTWGKPVVGTSVSGSVADRVIPGENGFIFEPGDVGALASHMAFFTQNRDELARFSQRARATACRYPVDIAVERLSELLEGL